MNTQNHATFFQKIQPWVIWSLAASVFFAVYIIRVCPSALVGELGSRYNTSLAGVGTLGFYFLLVYIGMQLPVGLLIDRFGARITLTLATLLCAFSTFLFAKAESLWPAQVARALLGFGAAFGFVNALKLAAYWFKPKTFSILVGATQALGMIGGAIGASLFSRLVETFDLMQSFFYFSYGLGILSLVVALVIRNHPNPSKQFKRESKQATPILPALKTILSHKATWIAALATGFLYAPTGIFAELWGAFYLHKVYGLSQVQASDAVGMIFVGWGVGGPLSGALSNHIGRRKTLLVSAISGFVLFPGILYLPNPSVFVLYVLLFAFGLVNSGAIAGYTLVAELHPKSLSATALGFGNGMSVVVAMACQPLVGSLIDLIGNLKLSMALILVCLFGAAVFAWFTKETLNLAN